MSLRITRGGQVCSHQWLPEVGVLDQRRMVDQGEGQSEEQGEDDGEQVGAGRHLVGDQRDGGAEYEFVWGCG